MLVLSPSFITHTHHHHHHHRRYNHQSPHTRYCTTRWDCMKKSKSKKKETKRTYSWTFLTLSMGRIAYELTLCVCMWLVCRQYHHRDYWGTGEGLRKIKTTTKYMQLAWYWCGWRIEDGTLVRLSLEWGIVGYASLLSPYSCSPVVFVCNARWSTFMRFICWFFVLFGLSILFHCVRRTHTQCGGMRLKRRMHIRCVRKDNVKVFFCFAFCLVVFSSSLASLSCIRIGMRQFVCVWDKILFEHLLAFIWWRHISFEKLLRSLRISVDLLSCTDWICN